MTQRKLNASRRRFARSAALTIATAATAPSALRGSSALPAVAQAATQREKLSPESQSEADAMYQAILRQHGDRLSDAQKKDLRRLVNEAQKPLETMRAFAVDNADQPGNVLKLYPDAPSGVPSSAKRAAGA